MFANQNINYNLLQRLAQCSRLSEHYFSLDDAHELLQKFAREMSSCLIFLRSVESITISLWQPEALSPLPLYSSSLAEVPRSSFTRTRLDAAASGTSSFCEAAAQIDSLQVITVCSKSQWRIRETFVVSSQVQRSQRTRFFYFEILLRLDAVPTPNLFLL
jgi:hypothetical protein